MIRAIESDNLMGKYSSWGWLDWARPEHEENEWTKQRLSCYVAKRVWLLTAAAEGTSQASDVLMYRRRIQTLCYGNLLCDGIRARWRACEHSASY